MSRQLTKKQEGSMLPCITPNAMVTYFHPPVPFIYLICNVADRLTLRHPNDFLPCPKLIPIRQCLTPAASAI